MKHQLRYIQYLDTKLPIAWDFFSSPNNLSILSPPDVTFKILTELGDQPIYKGQLIDYKVAPFLGIPLHWQTEITVCESPYQFIDFQRKGPYKFWSHQHTFTEKEEGVEMEDLLIYELSFGPIGNVMNNLIIQRKLKSIFEHRRQVCEKLFNEK